VEFDKWDSPKDLSWGKPINIDFYVSDDSLSLEDIIQDGNKLKSSHFKHQIFKTSFAKGSFNEAFYCIDNYKNRLVAKQNMKGHSQKFELFKEELNKNILCIKISELFNKQLIKKSLERYLVLYINVFLAQIEGEKKHYLFEGYIKGEFKKFTNNYDYINPYCGIIPLLILNNCNR
jgi:hypothetical protein